MELLGQKAIPFLVFRENSILFFTVTAPVYIPTNSVLGFPFLYNLTSTCCLLIWLWWPFWLVWSGNSLWFKFASLWWLVMLSILSCLWDLCILLGEVSRSFAHFLIGLFVFLEWNHVSSLYILEIKPLSKVSFANNVFPYYWFPFHFSDDFFSHAEFLFWWNPICLFFYLCPLL